MDFALSSASCRAKPGWNTRKRPMSDQVPNLDTLFLAALEIASPEERAAFLTKSCGADGELRVQVERLLKSHEQVGSFLDHPAPELRASVSQDEAGDARVQSLQAGLAAAFSEEQAVVLGDGNHSILKILSNTLHEVPRVALRESKAEGEDPIMRPQSQEVPAPSSNRRYQLQGEIARGGLGVIIKGRDTDLGRDLAIKVLLDAHKDTPEVIQRFVEEAQIGGQLQHPGITPIYELGLFADQRPFIAMKLVRGETLSNLMADRTEAAEDRGKLLGIFEQVCQTMAYAHSRGVIHRDLKPANIMVGAFGEVQVLDWGLAKVLSAGGVADEQKARDTQPGKSMVQTLRSPGSSTPGTLGAVGSQTQMGSVMGTPAYMPPEQALGEIDNLDERVDVFGLGAILCEILTGKPPYFGDDGSHVYRLARQGKLEACFERLKACSADADLVALTTQCLSRKPDDRPRNASVLAHRITAYLESVETKLRETELANVDARVRAEELRRRDKLAFAAGAAIVASLVIGTAASVWQAGRADLEATRARSAEQRALVAFDELRATAPAFAEQARTLVAKEQFYEAIEKLDYAVKLRPDVPEYLVAKADLLQCQLKLAEAAATYRDALRVQPGHARAEASARLCDELIAAQPGEQGKLTRESLAKLHLAMLRQQRPAAELMPVARLLGEEEKHLVEYWLARLEGLPISAERPLKDRLTVRDDGRLALDLSDTMVLDLSPLAGAPIAALNVSGIGNRSELTDIGPLRGFALVELNISNTEVADLAPLREMHTLEKLNLAGSKVTDLAALAELQLKTLSFQGCPISDLTPIHKMPLEDISLRQTRVADLAPLIGMPIKRIDLGQTPVVDFAPLAQLPLEKCYLHDNRITDLSVLRGKPLKELVLWGCNAARNFSAIAEIETLELLLLPTQYRTLPDEDYAAIGSLRRLPKLRQLGTEYIDGMGDYSAGVQRTAANSSEYTGGTGYAATPSKNAFWQDWDREQTFVPALRETGFNFTLTKRPNGLYSLRFYQQAIHDLSLLQGAPLSELWLISCVEVSDLSPIHGMPLELLNVCFSSVTDLRPLRGMPLTRLFLSGTNVTDLSPLLGLPLTDLYVDRCPGLSDLAPLAEIPTLKNLIVPIQETNVETLRQHPRLQRLGYTLTGDAPMLPENTAQEFWKNYDRQ